MGIHRTIRSAPPSLDLMSAHGIVFTRSLRVHGRMERTTFVPRCRKANKYHQSYTTMNPRPKHLIVSLMLSTVALMTPSPTYAVIPGPITGGLSFLSFGVGVLGITGGVAGLPPNTAGRFGVGLGGLAIAVLDPPEATYISGQISLRYPGNFLTVDSIGWFQEFALDPTIAVPPVTTNGFLMPGFYPLQAPNPSMNVSVSDSFGQLIVHFDSPTGIVVPSSSEHANILGVVFKNISESDLEWILDEHGGNLFQQGSDQYLMCRDADGRIYRCGSETPAFSYRVMPVPEPATYPLIGVAVLCFEIFISRGKLSRRSFR